MIIKAIDAVLVKYRSNFSLIQDGAPRQTRRITTTHKITRGNLLPYGLTIDWNVVYKGENTRKKTIACDTRFYMGFDVETEAKDRKDLTAYLDTAFNQAQDFIKTNSPEHYNLLEPIKLDTVGLAHHFLWDVIQFGCYGDEVKK